MSENNKKFGSSDWIIAEMKKERNRFTVGLVLGDEEEVRVSMTRYFELMESLRGPRVKSIISKSRFSDQENKPKFPLWD